MEGQPLESDPLGPWILAAALAAAVLLCLAIRRHAQRRETFPSLAAGSLRTPKPATRAERAVLSTILAVAFVLRLHDLGDGLWFDEIDTLVRYARRPLTEVVTSFDTQNNHLLYSVLARISFLVFGESAWALRLPAALLGVASLYALHRFALLITDRREALFATALLAFSYHHLWFSQNARGYTALLCFALLGSECFLRLLHARESADYRLAIGYAVWMALAVATHVTAVLIVGAHAILWMVLALRTREQPTRPWLPLLGLGASACLSVAAYALVLSQFLRVLAEPSMVGHDTEWKSPQWLLRETVSGLAAGIPGGWLALAGGSLVVALGLWSYARQSWVVLGVLLLGACVTAVVILVQGHNLWPRFFFFSAGFVALIVFRGWFELFRLLGGRRWSALASRTAFVGAVAICAVSASTLPNAWNPKQDFEGAREYVEAERASDDAVVTLEMAHLPYQKLLPTGWSAVDNIGRLLEVEREHRRTWVVYTTPTHLKAVQPEIWDRLEREYDEARVFPGTVRGGEVVVKVRR